MTSAIGRAFIKEIIKIINIFNNYFSDKCVRSFTSFQTKYILHARSPEVHEFKSSLA